jgi:hypothetical protein
MENKSPKTVGPKEGLGSGIAALGLVFILLPSLSAQIAAGNNATLVSILTGALWLFGAFTVIAGIAVIVAKFDE